VDNRDAVIGSSVHRLRTGRGLSQQDVADAMRTHGWKWTQSTVWSIEADRRPLRLAEAADLAGILGTSLPDLLQDPLSSLLNERETRAHQYAQERDLAAAGAHVLESPIAALHALAAAHAGEDVRLETYGIGIALDAFGDVPWDRCAAILDYLGVPSADIERLSSQYREHFSRMLDTNTDPMAGEPKPLDHPDFALWSALWEALHRALPSLHVRENPHLDL